MLVPFHLIGLLDVSDINIRWSVRIDFEDDDIATQPVNQAVAVFAITVFGYRSLWIFSSCLVEFVFRLLNDKPL